MSATPRFDATQRKELERLGVSQLQIAELGGAVSSISTYLKKRVPLTDIRLVLGDVLKSSDRLLKTIQRMSRIPSSASDSEAYWIVELGFWEQPDESGPLFNDYLCPGLSALSKAARKGLDELPQKPRRNKTADPHPIRIIEAALLLGWRKMQMPDEEPDSLSFRKAMIDAASNIGPQLPDELRPSKSPDCAFRRIVRICYEAAGGTGEQERAIKAFMLYKKNPMAWIAKHD